MRVDKFIVTMGLGTRSQAKSMVKDKRVKIDGLLATKPSQHLDPDQQSFYLDGVHIPYQPLVYLMLNKPKGVLSATEDARARTVIDLLEDKWQGRDLFPVGRLDKDTHGLLLLTNDGQLAHDLLSPKKHVTKIYRARVEGRMTQEDVIAFAQGIHLQDGTICLPAKLILLEESNKDSYVEIHLDEGKFHQVKRMVAACGKEVLDLQRIKMGPLDLDSKLELGQYRPLSPQELDALMVLSPRT